MVCSAGEFNKRAYFARHLSSNLGKYTIMSIE